MAERPWRCSQCGTINEPVANSCRTCGKWPSLFDLEDNVVEDDTGFKDSAFEDDAFEPLPEPEPEPVPTYDPPEPMTVEVETFEEPEPVAPAPQRRFGPPPTQPVFEEGEAEGRRTWVTWLVPLAFVAYIVISYVFSSR